MRGSQGLGQLGTQGATLFQTNRAVGILDSVISWGTLIYIYILLYGPEDSVFGIPGRESMVEMQRS